MRQQPVEVTSGQRWTFVHSTGKETEYVVVDPTDPEQMAEEDRKRLWANREGQEPHSIAYLKNEATGRFAMVTHCWLRRAPQGSRSHWLPPVSS